MIHLGRPLTFQTAIAAIVVLHFCFLQAAFGNDFENSPSAASPCPALTIDSRFAQLQDQMSGKEFSVGATHLLAEAFVPYLKAINTLVLNVPTSRLVELDQHHEVSVVPIHRSGDGVREPYSANTFCRIRENGGSSNSLEGSYNWFNKKAMSRLLRAICVVNWLTKQPTFRSFDESVLQDSRQLFIDKTFATLDLPEHLRLAFLTVLQSVAQLTSEPVADLNADEILRMSMQQSGAKPSLVVVHSLILPPAVIGRMGSTYYIPDAVISNGKGGLAFSPVYRDFIKQQRQLFDARKHQKFEMGHGCPVGHCAPGEERPALQYFLDAIVHVYDQIGDE